MSEKESKIIILTSGYEEHPVMRTDEEMKDGKAEEWPECFKGELENLKIQKEAQESIRKLNETFEKLTVDMGVHKTEKTSREIAKIHLSLVTGISQWMFGSKIDRDKEEEYQRRERIEQMNREYNKTAISLEDFKNEMEALDKDIDNQPVINIVHEIGKKKEGKLPRKYRKGW